MRVLGRSHEQIVCQQLVEKVTDYLEGDLDPRDRAAVEAHLTVCAHCSGYVEQVRRMLQLTGAVEPEPLPDALLDALTRRYRATR